MVTVNTLSAAFKPEGRYAEVCSRKINGQLVVVWSSTELEDFHWDDFLESTPLGQYQQSSLWARAKSFEDWRPLRIVLTMDDRVAGGFQILIRNSRFGSIGYISKGPVVVEEDNDLLDFVMKLVISTVKTNHLKALILQPPDRSVIDGPAMARHWFLPNHLVEVISATLLVDLSDNMDAISQRIRKNTMIEIRQAERRGIKIRPGCEQDVGIFFRLMLATCERQQTNPAPATEPALLAVWQALSRRDRVRLFLAEYDGAAVAGALCLCFGDRVTIWKKGWSGQHRERHPNQLLLFKAIEWAHQHGYKFFDFAALNPDTASTLLRGEPLAEDQRKSPDFVHLSYGNHPVLLPESRIYINNFIFRIAYRSMMASAQGRALLKFSVGNRIQ